MEPLASPSPVVDLPTALLVSLLAYVLGSFPTGAIIARLYRNIDLTQTGSERTGATNALRTMGLGAGVLVLAGDFVKGTLAVLIARHLSADPLAPGLAAFFAVVGHNRSLFLRGKGGRGVVTGLGGLAVVHFPIFVVCAIAGSAVAATTRYVSLGSLVGTATAMLASIVVWLAGGLPFVLAGYVLITGCVIIAAHADNIARLRAGTERRLGRQGGATQDPQPTG